MYQMLKLKLGPQDIRGTETQSKEGQRGKQCKKDRNVHYAYYQKWKQTTTALTYFDKSAGKHLLINLVF